MFMAPKKVMKVISHFEKMLMRIIDFELVAEKHGTYQMLHIDPAVEHIDQQDIIFTTKDLYPMSEVDQDIYMY